MSAPLKSFYICTSTYFFPTRPFVLVFIGIFAVFAVESGFAFAVGVLLSLGGACPTDFLRKATFCSCPSNGCPSEPT